MRFQTTFLLLAVLCVAIGSFTPKYANIIYAVQHGEELNNTCLTFQCISKLLSNSTEVRFNISDFHLTTATLIVTNLTNIALLGNDQTTTIHCDTMSTGDSSRSGVQFISVTNFTVENIRFVNCGSTYTDPMMKEDTGALIAAIHVLHSVNCTIKHVVLSRSNGRGLLFSETRGTVSVMDSTFHDNQLNSDRDTYPRGGGVFVKFNSTDISKTNYVFSNCSFVGNKAGGSQWPYSEGGGMDISFKGTSSNIHIHIDSSKFIGNVASWGGAVHVIFNDQASHNSFTATNTIFRDNEAPGRVGGAVSIGYRFPVNSSAIPFNNSGLFYNCRFTNNTAVYGGGVSIVSSKTFLDFQNRAVSVFTLKNSTWDGNIGCYGSAVDISPEVRSTLSDAWTPLLPNFEDCKFVNSKQHQIKIQQQGSWEQYTTGRGAFHVTSFTVNLSGELIFKNNSHSAVFLVGSVVVVDVGAQMKFSNNSGFDGGAIAIDGFSALRVRENSRFVFSDNTAERNGGAIFFDSFDRHNLVSKWSCFIQYGETESPTREHNVTFLFYNNQALNGPSIYASSILPCNNFYEVKKHDIAADVACITNFSSFENDLVSEVSTSGWHFEVNQTGPLQVLPGATTVLPIQLKDELGSSIIGVGYRARVINSQFSTIALDETHKHVYDEHLVIYGKPNDTGAIELSAFTGHKVVIVIDIEMLQCPPGFVIINDAEEERELPRCVCSADTMLYIYKGIRKCNYRHHFAYIQHNYWAGYRGEPTHENLLTGRCSSKGQCRWSNAVRYPLPNTTSNDELIERVCASNRIGILCSRCKEGYSVHYHATQVTCYEHSLCHIGWLLYVLSEVVPLTILFVVVMVFNVSFTSGSANAFIIFAQTFRLELITANNFVWVDQRINVILKIAHFIYRFFNIELFTADSLSFCLWKDAQTLDIAAFKYISITYCLLLIALMVLIMNICNVYRLFQAVSNLRQVQGCVIHGLTAFFILFYSQCTKVTLQILTPTTIRGKARIFHGQVVKEYGEMEYFSRAHLPYAIPAIICLFTIILPPPLLLLMYPLHYKIFRLLRINETKFVRLISFEKMKPLFDSFQGCYKDDFRFFMGVYFMFRLFSEVALAVTVGPHDYFPFMLFLLTVLILLLAICHPYQKNWHNILDIVIFISLLMICTGTMYTFYQQEENDEFCYKNRCYPLHTLQAIVSLLPLAYIVVYFAGKMIRHIVKQKANKAAETESLPTRLNPELNSDSSDEAEYLEYRENAM